VTQPEISPEFPYESRYVEVHGSKMHYVDEGLTDGPVVLFLHGNPTSSYLWRNIIPFVAPSSRSIAVDLIGMGHSDKPDIGYRFFDHSRYLEGFIEALGLRDLTLVLHDWGSALGFHYARRHEKNVRGIAFTEAILAPAKWRDFPGKYKTAFKLFRTPLAGGLLIGGMNVFVKQVLPQSIIRKLSSQEMAHYLEPYPTWGSRKPVRQWPREIPIDGKPADVHEAVSAYNAWLQRSEIPKLLMHAKPGALITRHTVEAVKDRFPNMELADIGRGLHFVQEDSPVAIGEALVDWCQRRVQ
jgi:haloalkane dehalogenase